MTSYYSQLFSTSVEGYCSAPAGDRVISVNVEHCHQTDNMGFTYSEIHFGAETGALNVPNKVTIEEFRQGTSIAGGKFSYGQLYAGLCVVLCMALCVN